jgi:hypothetical protein
MATRVRPSVAFYCNAGFLVNTSKTPLLIIKQCERTFSKYLLFTAERYISHTSILKYQDLSENQFVSYDATMLALGRLTFLSHQEYERIY